MNRLSKYRVLAAVALFVTLSTSLHALTIAVDQSQTGINGNYNITSGNPASARSGNWFHVRVRATMTNTANAADNWGCTSINLMGARRDRDHDDARIFTVTREINNAIQVPNGTVNTVYPVTINFYSGDKDRATDLCNGALKGSHTIYVKLTRAQKNVDLAFRSARNIRGDMKVIGNTAVCLPTKDWLSDDHWGREVGDYKDAVRLNGQPETTCLSPQKPRQINIWQEDDDLMYAYVRDDGTLIASINQSRTMAKLTLPPKAKIVQAKLYWVGRLANKKRGWNEFPSNVRGSETNCKTKRNDGSLFTSCNSGREDLGFGKSSDNPANSTVLALLDEYIDGVQLKVPGRGFVDVKPENVYYETDIETVHYAVNVDVTHLINPDQQQGDYFVQGINTKLHGFDFGTYGGWMLAVIYDNADDPAETYKNVSIYDGLRHLGPTGRSLEIYKSYTLKGFRTPLRGPVNAKLFYFAGDGSRDEADDCIKFNFANGSGDVYTFECGLGDKVDGYWHTGMNTRGKAVYIGGRGWWTANAFDGSITEGGMPDESRRWVCSGTTCSGATDTYGDHGKKPAGSNPSFDYTIGYDLHTYNLNNVLGNNQQETRVTFAIGWDQLLDADMFAPAFFALSTMIHAPVISELVQEANLSACTNSRNVKGRVMEYSLTFKNEGNEGAEKIDIKANLDELGIWKYIDLTKTQFIGMYELDSAGKEIPISNFNCAVVESGLGVRCTQTSGMMDIDKTYRMRYSVQFSENDTLDNMIANYKSGATLEYWNYETKEKMEVDAIVKTPYVLPAKDCFLGTCVQNPDPKKNLSIPVYTNSGGDGYYILKPVQSVNDAKYAKDPFDQSFLAYCKGIEAYEKSGATNVDRDESLIEIWLPLPMSDTEQKGTYSRPNSNFKFSSIAGATAAEQSYYNRDHKQQMFDDGKLKNLDMNSKSRKITGFGNKSIYGLRLNMVDLTLHDSMYDASGKFEFANINLIGTSFAIDTINSAGVKCGTSTPLYGLYNQVAKANTTPIENCTVEKLVFKQHEKYKYDDAVASRLGFVEPKPDQHFFESCSQVKTYADRKLTTKDGLFLINPPDNTRIPFVSSCIMEDKGGEYQYITTVFMGFDASNAYEPESVKNNTCMQLGLAFFVPTNSVRYENMRRFLQETKSGSGGWESYMGSVGNWTTGNTLGRYGGIFITDTTRTNTQLWPFGPFGVFKDKSGSGIGDFKASDGNGKDLHSPQMHTTLQKNEPASNTMGNYGWVTIFDTTTPIGGDIADMVQKMEGLAQETLEDSWWMADGNCKNIDARGAIQLEPNGDYDARTWLGYTYNADGSILSCNDEKRANYSPVNLPSYTHQNYACVGLDSYFPYQKRNISGLNAWSDNDVENTKAKANPKDGKLYTLAAGDTLNAKIAGIENDQDAELKARVCVRVVSPKADNACLDKANSCKDADYTENGGFKSDWFPVDFEDNKEKSVGITGLDKALKDAKLEFRYVQSVSASGSYEDCDKVDAADWGRFADGNIDNLSRDNFAIRPGVFSLQKSGSGNINKVVSGRDYDRGSRDDLLLSVNVDKYNGYIVPSGGFSETNISFTKDYGQLVGWNSSSGSDKFDVNFDTAKNAIGVYDVNFTYNDVGEFRIYITDNSWTAVDQGNALATPVIPPDCITAKTAPANTGLQYDWEVNSGRRSLIADDKPEKYQVGCIISGDYTDAAKGLTGEMKTEIRVIPYEFNVTAIDFVVPNGFNIPTYEDPAATPLVVKHWDKFAYYGLDINVSHNARAQNEKHGVTRNYTDGNYSNDVEIVFAFDPAGAHADRIDRAVLKKFKPDSAVELSKSVWKEGQVSEHNITMSYPREYSEAVLPLSLWSKTGDEFNISLMDKTDNEVTGSNWWSGGDDQITFVYGRANLHDISTDNANGDANITFTIDYYHPNGVNYSRIFDNTAPVSAAKSSSGWRLVEHDKSTIAKEIVIGSAAYGSPNTSAALILNGKSADIARVWGPYPDRNKPRPRRFIVHLSAPEYLWHMPYGQAYLPIETDATTRGNVENSKYCAQHQCAYVEFKLPSGSNFGGSGTDNSRYFKDDANTTRSPSRINW